MFTDRHYVPALKWKQGEYKALGGFADEQKRHFTPLVDLLPVSAEDANNAIPEIALEKIPQQMSENWGSEHPIFVDFGLLDPEARMTDGTHPAAHVYETISSASVKIIPVTGIDRDADYQTAVRRAIERDGRGCCIRLGADDAFGSNVAETVGQLTDHLGIRQDEVDLIIDFAAISLDNYAWGIRLALNVINDFDGVNGYRTLTLLAGAFPVNLASFTPGTIGSTPRTDWQIWDALRQNNPQRMPTFGDYTAAHPELPEVDFRFMAMSASIRYCSTSEWLIFRGRNVRDPRFGGYGQYRSLSNSLINHPSYCGEQFSAADKFIADCAAGTSRTGNPATWRRVATNHHIAFVLHQVANLPSL